MTGEYTPYVALIPETADRITAVFAAALERSRAVLIRVPVPDFDTVEALRAGIRAWSRANPGHLEHIAHACRAFEEIEPEKVSERGFPSFRMIDPYLQLRFPMPADPKRVDALLDALLDLVPVLEVHTWPNRPELDLEPRGIEA